MSKMKLSIYLIERTITQFDAAVSPDGETKRIELDNGLVVYVKEAEPHTPKWVSGFFEGRVDPALLMSSSASALCIVPVQIGESGCVRGFALSFGYGYTLLDRNAIEERFGLRVALNQAKRSSLRKIKRTSVAENARKTAEQMPFSSPIESFGIDISQDLLDGVTVSGGENLLATGSITGSDSLSLSVDETIATIPTFLERVYGVYELDNYKKEFEWIDRIVSVRSQAKIDALNNEAVELIRRGDPSIWMAVPEVIEWESIAGFKVSGSQGLYDDVCIDDVLCSVDLKTFEYSDLKKTRIQAIGQAGDAVVRQWTATRCLYGEVEYQGVQYCANNGKWYRVDAEYKQKIEDSYKAIPLCSLPFPECFKNEREDSYNMRLTKENPLDRILMDKKTVYYGGKGSQVELCDVLCTDGKFIHVKHYSGSCTLSHLFNQGYVSARLVRVDPEFRNKAQEKIDSVDGPAFPLRDDSVKEVVYAIISRKEGDRPEIPFFSKVSLDLIAREMGAMGVGVSVASVKQVEESDRER